MNRCNQRGCRNLEYRCKDCGRVVNEVNIIELTPEERWISVKTRLPTEKGGYLIFVYGEIEKSEWTQCLLEWGFKDLYDEEFGEAYPKKEVTHWMPFPDPPK